MTTRLLTEDPSSEMKNGDFFSREIDGRCVRRRKRRLRTVFRFFNSQISFIEEEEEEEEMVDNSAKERRDLC